MLYQGKFGKSLVTEEFNQMCFDHKVEARVQPFPNPSDPFRCMRLITFKNFDMTPVRVTQFDKKKQLHFIPARISASSDPGELQIMLMPDEDLPLLEKETNA